MSGTITVTQTVRVVNGVFVDQFVPGVNTITETNLGYGGGSASVSTSSSGQSLSMGSVGTLGWAYFQNTDSTNYVEVGVLVSGTFYPSIRMLAGESATLRLSPGVTYYARANTGAVLLNYRVWEN